MVNRFMPFLGQISVKEPLMWMTDTETGDIIDMTPATAVAEGRQSHGFGNNLRTLSSDCHLEASRRVSATGESCSQLEWIKYDGSWHKIAWFKSHAGGSRVLEICHDITHLDPRSEWLARINLESQRLELESGESVSFEEFVVLHMLLKGYRHSRIARTLNISTKTVEYRISRLKNALAAETTEEMMEQVSSSGLIYLALIPIDLADPAKTELELYKKVNG